MGSCPETVPVTLYQTILQLDGVSVVEDDYEGVGDGITQAFDLGHEPHMVSVVSVGGNPQGETRWSVAGQIITFTDIPAFGEEIMVRFLRAV
jgi:hypothetical protein